MTLKATRLIMITWVALSFLVLVMPAPVEATGSNTFSGSDISNYVCPILPEYAGPYTGKNNSSQSYPEPTVDKTSNYVCVYFGKAGNYVTNATIQPPTLRVVQYWFVRILYILWAASGTIFTGIMIYLGFRYMTSGGDAAVLADVKKRAKNWFIGLALIFLSYPILGTIFRILPINKTTDCYKDLQLPGFQFFFATACDTTDASSTSN